MNRVRVDEPNHEATDGWASRERLLVLVLGAVTAIAFVLCSLMVSPFLPALAWALALGVVARPLHTWVASWIKNADAAAAVSVTLVGLLLIVPSVLIAQRLINEAANGIERGQNGGGERWQAAIDKHPRLATIVHWVESNIDVRGEVPKAVGAFVKPFNSILTGSVWALTQLLLMLFTLYFFFRDRARILGGLRYLVPLSHAETDEVYARVSDTIHATVYGTVVVAMVQGFLGGLMFWWLGLPGPITWGLIMGLLAIIPYLGAFIVWVPAAVVLALNGEVNKALLLTAWGTIAIGLIDNLLYPLIVGQRLRLHTLLAFFAIVGGLVVFGGAGLILGPVVVAVTIALVDVWKRRTRGGRTAEEGVNAPREPKLEPSNGVRTMV